MKAHHLCASMALAVGLFGQATVVNADVRYLDIVTNDLIYNTADEKIYASIPSTASENGNSIVTIDPITGAIGSPIYVGSEPDQLALSDDGEYLYIDLSGSASVLPLHIPTQTTQTPIVLGDDPRYGPLYAQDIEVQPGSPETIAVSLKRLAVSPKHGGVAVYSQGVKLPEMTKDHTGSNVIEFGFDPNILYGYNNETSEFGFRTMDVTASGASISGINDTEISGYKVNIEFHDGIMYSTSGDAIDPATGSAVGTFSNVAFADAVAVDSGRNKVYFLDNGQIQTYNKSTFILENTSFYGGSITDDLVLWGTTGLAYRTQDQVVLISDEITTATAVYPKSGKFLKTQAFDLGIVVSAPSKITGFSASIGSVNLKRILRNCVFGKNDLEQKTIRCPNVGTRIANTLGNGPHVLDVKVDLEDSNQLESSVTWEFIPTTEFN